MTEIDYKTAAVALWGFLDDIDTADDMAKDNDSAYRAIVGKLHKKRFAFAESPDGYELVFKPIPLSEEGEE